MRRLNPSRPRPTRRRPWPPRRRRLAFAGGIVAAVAVALGGGAWLVASGWVERQAADLERSLVAASAHVGFAVERVLADGRVETTSSQVLSATGVRLGAPIFAVDLVAARARLLMLPWVESATIERRLPDTLYVRIAEIRPLALWQKQQRLYLLGADGRVIAGADVARFADLPVVVGPDAPVEAAALLAMLAGQPELRRRVTAAVRVGGRRWNLRLDNGIEVQLPAAAAAAWGQLARLERDYGILGRDLTVIDLRDPDRLMVQLAPAAAARGRAEGDDT